jgi:hypothetical protein
MLSSRLVLGLIVLVSIGAAMAIGGTPWGP